MGILYMENRNGWKGDENGDNSEDLLRGKYQYVCNDPLADDNAIVCRYRDYPNNIVNVDEESRGGILWIG